MNSFKVTRRTKVIASIAVVGTVAAIAALAGMNGSSNDISALGNMRNLQAKPLSVVEKTFQDFLSKHNRNYGT